MEEGRMEVSLSFQFGVDLHYVGGWFAARSEPLYYSD
jgi:hypothetical protein